MGDIFETNNILHGLNGYDREIPDDPCLHTYNDDAKRILCQYEDAAAPAKAFSLFTQTGGDSWSSVLFAGRVSINTSCKDAFPIVPSRFICFPVLLAIQIITY